MPIACVFLSTALIQTTRMEPTPKIAFAAGLLAGMSCYGYFIYLFFLPTIIIFALFAWRASKRLPALLISAAAGFSLFILPYFVGFGFFVLVLVFGDRLWLHHASSVLPVLYVGLTLAIDRLASTIRHPATAGAIVAVLVMPFIVANAVSQQELFTRLETTGGVGLS